MNIRNFFFNRITANILAGAILILALIFGTRVMLDKITRHNLEITVPDLTNITVAEAGKIASEKKIKIEVIDSVYVKRMGKGLVYRQNPKAGSKVKEGRRILLTINAINAKKVMMPNLIGYSLRQAKAEILSKGLQVGHLEYVTDIATNNVLRQLMDGREISPGTMVESGGKIDLTLGLNNDDCVTYAPMVIGMKYSNAYNTLTSLGFQVSLATGSSYDGEVIDQSVTGSAPEGTSIVLTTQSQQGSGNGDTSTDTPEEG